MNKDDRIDRLLRSATTSRQQTSSAAECLDAETLAAWMDGSLTVAERNSAEAHLADCDRCLAVVAAIADLTPAPASPSRWLPVRWLIPLTTAAACITAWVLVQGPRPTPSPAVPAPVIDALKPKEGAITSERDAQQERRPDAPDKKDVPATEAIRFRDEALARRSADTFATQSKTTVDTSKGVAPQEKSIAEPSRGASVAAPTPTEPPARAEALRDLRADRLAAARSARIVSSPDAAVSWRISGASIERSSDGGRTWRPQPTGTTAELLAGASPTPSVCWIVGRSGLVLVTTDGETWRRLDFPDNTVDLVNVSARDGLTAAVTTAAGRSYRTVDGGRNWTLQENPPAPF